VTVFSYRGDGRAFVPKRRWLAPLLKKLIDSKHPPPIAHNWDKLLQLPRRLGAIRDAVRSSPNIASRNNGS